MSQITIRPIDIRNISDDDAKASHELRVALAAERTPDDPAPKWEDTQAQLQSIPTFVDVWVWFVEQEGKTLGTADLGVMRADENQHLAQFSIKLLPETRRQGLGKLLLKEIVAVAEAENRTLLMTDTASTVPSGAAFLERVGATVGLESHVNQLKLAEIPGGLLDTWTSDLADGFTPGLWEGPYPEESIEEILQLFDIFNTVPRGELQVDDFKLTLEQLRQQEESRAKRGVERWSLYVRDNETGKIAGFTELMWNPHKPTFAHQGITAVWPQYRGKRLGRWLKAELLKKLVAERPNVTIVRTENADSNDAMLKINTELGFKPYLAELVWQVPTETVKGYLG
ncbi:GNAT family N-acetyltransferase [Armatimonas sp.]|uniref:GNAT family N-acetyltransferase n=1 Tax=Armatimonas sp. TaxID=1872638 RepID=UPI00286A54D9|nr:GNAT family N-acetyltransferase [Armatimonas sp.]